MDNADNYQAYLLRAWRDEDPESGWVGPWHFSLERPGLSDRRGFRSLAELSAFFQLSVTDVETGDKPSVAATDPTQPME